MFMPLLTTSFPMLGILNVEAEGSSLLVIAWYTFLWSVYVPSKMQIRQDRWLLANSHIDTVITINDYKLIIPTVSQDGKVSFLGWKIRMFRSNYGPLL